MTSPAPEVLLDLGNVTDLPDAPEAGPGPDWMRWARPRWVRVGVVVVAALSLLVSAGSVPRPPVTRVIDVAVGPQAHVVIADGRVFINSYALPDTITAYRLADGARLWSVDEQEHLGLSMFISDDGSIIASDANSPTTSTESFDAATGRRLWTSDLGDAVRTAHGVLVQVLPWQDQLASGYAGPTGYQLLDMRTGAVIWSHDVPDGCITAFDQDVTVLVEVCPSDSSVRTIDLGNGREIAKRVAPLGQGVNLAQLDPAEVMQQPQVSIVGQTILIAHANVPTPTVDAYALDTLTTRWTGLSEEQAQGVDDCGDAICFYSTPDAGIRIDAATGASLGPLMPTPPTAVPAGALELAGPDGARPIEIPTVPSGTDVPVGPDGTGTAWLERAPGELIAPLPDVGASACALVSDYIVCATTNDRVRIWRVS